MTGKVKSVDKELQNKLGFTDFRNYGMSKKQRVKKNKEIIELALQAANGNDDIKKGAVGFGGYGFVFRDEKAMLPYFPFGLNSKVCSVGALRGFYERFTEAARNSVEIKSFKELQNYDEKYDLYFGGSLKTLVPALEFGGFELFYEVWFFAKTPDGKMFPANFYWAQSGTSLRVWDLERIKKVEARTGKSFFPEEFGKVINFSPFNFSKEEEDEFVEALMGALDKVPPSDFRGIRQSDDGICEMGIESGEPFIRWIDEYEYEYDEETNSLKEIKYPSSEYTMNVLQFRHYIDPELEAWQPEIPFLASYEEENKITDNLTYFEKVLLGISDTFTIFLEDLQDYASEVFYNETRQNILKKTSPTEIKQEIDEMLIRIKNNDIKPLTEKLVDRKASRLKRYDPNTNMYSDFYSLTPVEREKAIEIVEEVLTKIVTPAKHIDNLLQYIFFKKLFRSFFFKKLFDYFSFF